MQIRKYILGSISAVLMVILALGIVQAQDEDEERRLLADFEVETLFIGQDGNGNNVGFVPWGGNITIDVVAAEGDIALPDQEGENTVMVVDYEVINFGGFTHVFTDEAEWTTEDWTDFTTFEFWLYGANSGAEIQVEIFDNRAEGSTGDTAERWYYRVLDDFEGWQRFAIPFDQFQRRTDWQPGGAPSDGLGLTEVHGYAFGFPAGAGAHINYIDNVMVSNAEGNVPVVVGEGADEMQAETAEASTETPALLADFELEELFIGQDGDGNSIGFVAWGDAPENVTLDVVAADGDLALPEQDGENAILSISYDIASFGGFTHVFTDETDWTTQDWTAFSTFEFWLYGANTGSEIQVEIFDNRAEGSTGDTAERWYYRILDDFEGWQQIAIPFNQFQRRTDWQPGGAPSDDLGLTAVHGYAFGFPAGVGAQTSYIDNVMVSNAEGNVPIVVEVADSAASEGLLSDFVPVEYNPDGEWELVWSDEFDAEEGEPINPEYWTCEVGGWGWGNNQLEHNTDRTENVYHNGEGFLAITAREEEYRGNDYTSGRCNTMDKVEFTYGRVEARIDLPEGQGIWPAFWMLGADFPEIGWPDSGEIDIMEYVGKEPRSTHGTVHGPGYSGGSGIGARYLHEGPAAEGFHVFGIEWEPEVIRWYVDDEVFFEMTPDFLFRTEWVFDHDFFMLINVAVGGEWPGNPDDTTVFPQSMLIDWIRVYQRQ